VIDDDGICWDAGTRFDGALIPAERGAIRDEPQPNRTGRASERRLLPLRAEGMSEPRRRWWHRFWRDVDAT
jgi:hypothetical protein